MAAICLHRAACSSPARKAFAAKFDITRFNPARFGAFPQARLNARGQVAGVLMPGFSLKAGFELPPGELEGHPVVGKGRAELHRWPPV